MELVRSTGFFRYGGGGERLRFTDLDRERTRVEGGVRDRSRFLAGDGERRVPPVLHIMHNIN